MTHSDEAPITRTRVRLSTERHPVDELTWVSQGRAILTVDGRTLIATPELAVYVPAGARHGVHLPSGSAVEPLFLPGVHRLGSRAHRVRRTTAIDALAASVLHPTPDCAPSELPGRVHRLVDALVTADRGDVPAWPTDRRASAVAERVREDPSDPRTLTELARSVGTSARTLQRCFLAETGLPFSQWRARWRLSVGVRRLHGGSSVGEAAAACGYTPSAFIARYREAFGVTPGLDVRRGTEAALSAQGT